LSTLFLAGVVGPFLVNADESNVLDLEKRRDRDTIYRQGGKSSGEKRSLDLEKRRDRDTIYRQGGKSSGEKRSLDLEKRRDRDTIFRQGGKSSDEKRGLEKRRHGIYHGPIYRHGRNVKRRYGGSDNY